MLAVRVSGEWAMLAVRVSGEWAVLAVRVSGEWAMLAVRVSGDWAVLAVREGRPPCRVSRFLLRHVPLVKSRGGRGNAEEIYGG